MSRHTQPGLFVAILFCCPVHDALAGLNKCTNGKQITYTTEPCEKTGLRSAGPIKDAVTVMPLLPRPQKDSAEKAGNEYADNGNAPRTKAPRADDSGADVSRETTIKPVSPLINKMLDQ